jgi:hypothetical protein
VFEKGYKDTENGGGEKGEVDIAVGSLQSSVSTG